MAFMVDRSVGVLLFFFQFLAGDLHRYPSDGTWILPKAMANTLDDFLVGLAHTAFFVFFWPKYPV